MIKCKYCKDKQVPAYNLKNNYYSCSRCHTQRHKRSMAKAQHKYLTQSLPKGVYCITEKVKTTLTGGDAIDTQVVIYVGESGRMKARYYHHFVDQGSDKATKNVSKVNAYIKEKGRQNFEFSILEEVSDTETRKQVEKYYISLYKPIFNTYGK